jgi:hypothetical protein
MTYLWNITLVCGLAVSVMASGCGGKEEVVVAPPPAVAEGVSLTAAPAAVGAPVLSAPGAGGPEVVAVAPPGAVTPAGPENMFKGMSEREIKEFKETATPETHDLNLPILMEGVTGFMAEFKRVPSSQEEMVKARYLQRVMPPPKGKRYVINPESGEVTTESLVVQ